MKARRDIDEIILRIHGAVLDAGSWLGVLNEVRRCVNADKALLHSPFVLSAADYWCQAVGIGAREMETYATDWISQDLWVSGALTRDKNRAGVVTLDEELVERRTFVESAFFRDYLRHHDVERSMISVLQEPDVGRGLQHVSLSFFRVCGEPAFSNADAELLRLLMPHLMVAARNYWRNRSLALEAAGLKGLIDFVATPVFGVCRRGRVVYWNASGEAELRTAVWLQLTGGATLAAGRQVVESRSVAGLVRGLQSGIGGSTLLTNAATGERAILTTAPLRSPHAVENVAAIAGLAWLTRPSSVHTSTLAQLFEFTEAENQLVGLLSRGLTLHEVAQLRDVSIHTVRNQLKVVFRKTGQRTQAQLVALATRAQMLADPRDRP